MSILARPSFCGGADPSLSSPHGKTFDEFPKALHSIIRKIQSKQGEEMREGGSVRGREKGRAGGRRVGEDTGIIHTPKCHEGPPQGHAAPPPPPHVSK